MSLPENRSFRAMEKSTLLFLLCLAQLTDGRIFYNSTGELGCHPCKWRASLWVIFRIWTRLYRLLPEKHLHKSSQKLNFGKAIGISTNTIDVAHLFFMGSNCEASSSELPLINCHLHGPFFHRELSFTCCDLVAQDIFGS